MADRQEAPSAASPRSFEPAPPPPPGGKQPKPPRSSAAQGHRHWIDGRWVPCSCNFVRVVWKQGGGVARVAVTK